jgi:hypothetical protein
MAALCTPQEVTKPGIYQFDFLFICSCCHKGPIIIILCLALTILVSKFTMSRVSFSLTLIFFGSRAE